MTKNIISEDVYENMSKAEIIDILEEMEEDHAEMYDRYIELEKELKYWHEKALQLAKFVEKMF
ncbi:MAG: hypothetical protein IJ447_00025 [Clostridia bacterium]|nr:hypothetical protein [Clostridia bacterium]